MFTSFHSLVHFYLLRNHLQNYISRKNSSREFLKVVFSLKPGIVEFWSAKKVVVNQLPLEHGLSVEMQPSNRKPDDKALVTWLLDLKVSIVLSLTWTTSCFSTSMYIKIISIPFSLVLGLALRHLVITPAMTSPATLHHNQHLFNLNSSKLNLNQFEFLKKHHLPVGQVKNILH